LLHQCRWQQRTIGGISVGGGFTLCAPNLTLAQVQALPGGAGFIAPFEQEYDFNKVLPNVGAVYNFDFGLSLFASYAQGFSAPRTDNLYRATDGGHPAGDHRTRSMRVSVSPAAASRRS
jgi:outer membrane receptor protein involved in Fe transport